MQTVAERIENLQRDFTVIEGSPSFQWIGSDPQTKSAWSEARALAALWLSRIKSESSKVDEPEMQSIFVFASALIAIGNGEARRPNETAIDAIRRVKYAFQESIPLLAFSIFEASGLLSMSEAKMSKWKEETIKDINACSDSEINRLSNLVNEAIDKIRESAGDAAKDFESAKVKASRITVDSAQEQFQDAAASFKRKLTFWSLLTSVLFCGLLVVFVWLWKFPPALIREVAGTISSGSDPLVLKVPIPLLIISSAYYTGVRLGIIGVLGIGMAFSLRMTRAYLHLIEHNHHKLRVTNSIEAFVAAVRTPDQKDLVLGKLVESVTEFGDPGIIGKDGDAASFPSVAIEALTKNVSKTS